MEKIILVQEKVDDLYGLYMDLRRSDFAVKNVGVDPRGTYVYVDEYEKKDPVPLVRAWIGKRSPEPSQSLKKKRTREYEEILEAERKAEAARKAAELAMASEEARKNGDGSGIELIGSSTEAAQTSEANPAVSNIHDADGNVIGELMGGPPQDKESWFKRIWKKLF